MTSDHLPLRLGLVIRRHREVLLLTREEFAHVHGINMPYYSAVERGGRTSRCRV